MIAGITLTDSADYHLWRVGLGESYDNIADGFWGVPETYDQGALPFLHLMFHEARQPGCTIQRIAAGDYDRLIEDWLVKLLAYCATGRKVVVTYLPEMNGDWTVYGPEGAPTWHADPWSFIQAWRAFVGRARGMGLDETMVKWCWAPNNYGRLSLADWYPGDEWVDIIGGSAYNWGGLYPGYEWQSPAELFDPYVAEIRGFTAKPIVITQTGTGLGDADSPQWISDMAAYNGDIIGVIYFNIGEFEYKDRNDWNARVGTLSDHRPDEWFEEVHMKVFIVGDTGLVDGLALWSMAEPQDVLLYVNRDLIPQVVKDEISRLEPSEIVIVGGPARVSDVVEEELRRQYLTTRVSGASRFSTVVEISRRVNP